MCDNPDCNFPAEVVDQAGKKLCLDCMGLDMIKLGRNKAHYTVIKLVFHRLLLPTEIVKDTDEIADISTGKIEWVKPELSQIGYAAMYCHTVRRKISSFCP
ncbi:MAG: hypothetical protein DRN81_01245 [Thermoproteota archaeon]|nr:MAG: hypothetical protein DRN81_01245 [Candidatus Korarchaeota archaeon]